MGLKAATLSKGLLHVIMPQQQQQGTIHAPGLRSPGAMNVGSAFPFDKILPTKRCDAVWLRCPCDPRCSTNCWAFRCPCSPGPCVLHPTAAKPCTPLLLCCSWQPCCHRVCRLLRAWPLAALRYPRSLSSCPSLQVSRPCCPSTWLSLPRRPSPWVSLHCCPSPWVSLSCCPTPWVSLHRRPFSFPCLAPLRQRSLRWGRGLQADSHFAVVQNLFDLLHALVLGRGKGHAGRHTTTRARA